MELGLYRRTKYASAYRVIPFGDFFFYLRDLVICFLYLDAVPGEDQIRVVPSLRGKSGGVWSKYAFPHSDWEVVVTFRVQGKGRVGADGLVTT